MKFAQKTTNFLLILMKNCFIIIFLSCISLMLCLFMVAHKNSFTFPSKSMEPSIKKNSIIYLKRDLPIDLSIGKIVCIESDKFENRTITIRRVIGIPGDTIYWNQRGVYSLRNNKKLEFFSYSKNNIDNDDKVIQLGDNEYFLIGDNYNNSIDSRMLGPFSEKEIIANVLVIKNG